MLLVVVTVVVGFGLPHSACLMPHAAVNCSTWGAAVGCGLSAVGVVGVARVKIGFLMAKQNGTERNGMEQRQRFATFCVSNGAEDELREAKRKRE